MKSFIKLRFVSVALFALVAINVHAYELIEGVLENSKIYPGTVHKFSVSIPADYDASYDAALFVGLDGVMCDAPGVFDNLIAEGSMPMTIGVYLIPGVIKDENGEVLRYNRSNEFDATDARFAEFLETELLPAVKSMTTPDGKAINISDNPQLHAIYGLSSGGIAAFNAAWHRPDLFGKVFMGCATLVPMRGGHNLQAIVRKHEPKPIKIMLQDTFHDTWNPLFGSWYEANVLMASALEFAGYDVKTDWVEGGHSPARACEIFPDVMRWLWSSADSSRTTSNNLLAPMLIKGEDWEEYRGEKVTLSPGAGMHRAVYPDGTIVASCGDEKTNFLNQSIINKQGEEENLQRFYWLHTYDNTALEVGGMAFDGDGNLWAVTNAGIQICDQNGRVRGILSLPNGIEVEKTGISILQGKDEGVSQVILITPNGKSLFKRNFILRYPQQGVRPASQGQG